jgi:hypothetical protein
MGPLRGGDYLHLEEIDQEGGFGNNLRGAFSAVFAGIPKVIQK